MPFPAVSISDWRAQVDKELGGASFDQALVYTTIEGLAIQPLYTENPAAIAPPGTPPFVRGSSASPAPFRVCMRHDVIDPTALITDLEGGADALWIRSPLHSPAELDLLFSRTEFPRLLFWLDPGVPFLTTLEAWERSASRHGFAFGDLQLVLAADPLGEIARGRLLPERLAEATADLTRGARVVHERFPGANAVAVSTVPYHDAGADAADEIAIALATGAAYFGALLEAGLGAKEAARLIAVQVCIGRETFVELAKLRALRVCIHKLFAAFGATEVPLGRIHAVCSSRTLTTRDPWVNMLRVTTQVFAAALGGADLVTPAPFDQALRQALGPAFGSTGAFGLRAARNTGLVLREESHLGKVIDPAGGSYYLEAITDALARESWRRFQALEREGGMVEALFSGRLRTQLESRWQRRRAAVARRQDPVTGVSEFADLDEKLPVVNLRTESSARSEMQDGAPPLPIHRDSESFEALRARADRLTSAGRAVEVLLVPLGSPSEHRARVGFAGGFFPVGGLRVCKRAQAEVSAFVCLCGSDERYGMEAADRARSLKAAGAQRILVAGRPGALESTLRAAGVDAFIFAGCDAVSVVTDLLDCLDACK
jgi:methylmalonyl-CoA mutase